MYFGSGYDLNGLLASVLVLVVNVLWITLIKETCSKCGQELQAGWKCCPACGTEGRQAE